MALQALQGLCPSMHLACRLARPCFPPKSTLRSSFRSLKTGVKPKLCIAKASSDFGADLEKDINESTLAVDTMVQEISKTLFIDTATAYVVGETATAAAFQEAVATTVKTRLDTLNATFLPIINSYIESVEENGEEQRDLLGVLLAIKGQVLSQLAEQLPPEMRVIQKALEASSAEERMQLLRTETSSNSTPINPGSLAFTVARMIQDFEGADDEDAAEEIADRGLLARLCLLREELRQLADEADMTPWKKTGSSGDSSDVNVEVMVEGEDGYTSIEETSGDGDARTAAGAAAPTAGASPYTALRGVPAREVSFLKEIMGVASSEKRRSLLEAAFQGNPKPINGSGGNNKSETSSNYINVIRPGAFMDCIKALQSEMLGPQYGYGTETNQGTLVRLEEVWRESILVLEDIAGDANYMP
ncbi:hypothetical protein Ndes2526A_g06579 [Nannochloris sp. 'desiccata']|nr:hypothetical protein KSW81_008374 [Chlorella desiccata (nom. nud.)]